MHNLKEIRKDFNNFKKSLEKRSIEIDISNLEQLDKKNRELIQKKESLEQEKKEISKSKDKSLFEKSKKLSQEIDNITEEQKKELHKIRTDIAKLYNQDIGKKSQSLSLLKTLYGLKDKLSEGDFTSAAKKLFCDLKQNNLHDVEIPDEMSSLNTNNIIKKVICELEDIINTEAKGILKKYLPFYKIFTNFNFEI